MGERRADQRQRRLKSGTIVFNNSSSVYSCTVRNLSSAGACLVVSAPLTVPAQFELMVDGDRLPCTVTWRRPDRIGVKF
jgi:hypothetical protein